MERYSIFDKITRIAREKLLRKSEMVDDANGDSSCGRCEAPRRTACGFLLVYRLFFAAQRAARANAPQIRAIFNFRSFLARINRMPRYSRSDVNPICAEYHDKAHPRGQARTKRGAELVRDNNDLSRRDIMLIRNLQFFLRVCLRPFAPCAASPRPTVRGRDGTGQEGEGLPLDFLLTITPVRRLLITNCLLCRSGVRAWYRYSVALPVIFDA